MTLLGIDYGLKRVGIAVSDDGENFAFPLKVLQNDNASNLSITTLIEEITQICKEKNIHTIVMGESKDFKGEDNAIMLKIREFQTALESKNPDFQIHFEPEWMTTQQAERFQGKKSDIDSSAAAVILQSYIDRMKFKTSENK